MENVFYDIFACVVRRIGSTGYSGRGPVIDDIRPELDLDPVSQENTRTWHYVVTKEAGPGVNTRSRCVLYMIVYCDYLLP